MIFVYKCLVTCDLLGVTEHHCCKGDWQQDSASCCICLFYHLCCVCAFRMVGCPRVVGTVHVQFARLYCHFACTVVHDPYAGGCSRCVRQAMELCCVCVCACGHTHEYENHCPKSHQSRNLPVFR